MRRGPEGLPHSPRERNFFETGDSLVQPYFSATSKKDPKFWRSNSNCECPEVETPDGNDNAALCDGYSSVGVYSTETYGKLSRRAIRIFQKASRAEVLIYVPAMALWEAGLLVRIGRFGPRDSFTHWVHALLAQPGFALAPLDADVIGSIIGTNFSADPFDLGIVATAYQKQLPLITKDEVITRSKIVDITW